MGRNYTVLSCSISHRTSHNAWPGGGRPLMHVIDDRLQTTPTDDSVQNNTGPLGGPVTRRWYTVIELLLWEGRDWWHWYICVDRGLSPATCEKIYIDTARYLDTYGVHMFPATWVSLLSIPHTFCSICSGCNNWCLFIRNHLLYQEWVKSCYQWYLSTLKCLTKLPVWINRATI